MNTAVAIIAVAPTPPCPPPPAAWGVVENLTVAAVFIASAIITFFTLNI